MAADHGDSSNQAGPEKAEPSEINHSGTESAREMRSEQESDGQGERNPSGNEPAGSNSEASASKAGTPEESAEKTADKEKTGEGGKEGRDGNAGGGGEEVEEDEIDPQNPRGRLLMAKHAKYIKNLDKKTEGIEYVATEHLRMSGAYWGLTAMDLMGRLKDMHSPAMLPWLLSCQQPNGGFGGSKGHDSHLLYTLSAVQILALLDKLDAVDADRIATYVAGLQQPDGSFIGDEWGEVDTRFSYCAISCLSLLDRTHVIDLPAAVRFIASCQNFDGGFGSVPGGESHAGQIFCCVAALAVAGALSLVDRDLLGWWLCERQVPAGGLNGRPEKLPDVCYSWWVLSSLVLIDRVHWISAEKLQHFILQCQVIATLSASACYTEGIALLSGSCNDSRHLKSPSPIPSSPPTHPSAHPFLHARTQDEERGGISDRPNDMVDVFHTFFGIAGLSLLEYPNLKPVDPAFALPMDVVDRPDSHAMAAVSLSSSLGSLAGAKLAVAQSTSAKTSKVQAVRCVAGPSASSAGKRAEEKSIWEKLGTGAAAFGLAAALQLTPSAVDGAKADEFAILRSPPPLESHYYDDANVLSRITRSDIKKLLTDLEERTGYHIDAVTLRKIAGKGDVFELADKILESWYPTVEEGDKRGVVLLVTSQKEGAVAGGPTFIETIGDEVFEGIVSENLPVLATEERYNEAMYSTTKRLVARINGEPDIPGPKFNDAKRESNYKTREETDSKRDQFTTVVGGLLVIAFVVPMLQYYAYVKK
ncbi:unnamed protein product [Closterium sp. NIES-53]